MSRGVFSTAAKLVLKQISIDGPHSRFARYPRVLCHLAVQLCTEPERLRYMAEGNRQQTPDGEGPRSIDRPQKPINWQQALRQTTNFERLRDPPQITAFIKQQQKTAIGLTTGPHPDAGLTSFCAGMDGLLCTTGASMNYIHHSAIITAAMHIWVELQRSPSFRGHAEVSERLKPLFQRCLQRLHVLLADMGAREISNVLWSSATLSFNPDDAVPGMVHALTVRFLQTLQMAERKQQPNTRDVANMLWALVAMGHPAATAQVVGPICLHFGRLSQHTDAQQRPTAKECAEVLSSVAKLGHSSAAIPEMVDSVCLHFARLTQHSDVQQRPTAHACANLLWAVAKMGHSPAAATEVVDSVCLHFARLTKDSAAQQRPKAQHCASAMWALARLGCSSVAATEMMDSVCLHFARLVESPVAQQRPSSQDVANLVWALGTSKHTPPDDRLLNHVCAYMHTLLQSLDERFRPTAQECANAVWALARLGHSSATAAAMIGSVCWHFGRLVRSPTAQQRPTAQAVANLVWALATLKHTPPDDRLLDGLCEYMRSLVFSQDQGARPNAQAIANTVWALAQLKHAPSHDTVTAMYDYLVDLCCTPGLQPDSQNISNSFIACAQLGLDVKPTCVEALLKHFMAMHISNVRYQHYSNLAWSLAVMQSLDLNIFEALLDKLTTKHKLFARESGHQSSLAPLHIAESSQLHQAMVWLRPHSDFRLMNAWSSLQSRLLTVALKPGVKTISLPGQRVMWDALAMQGVPYQAQVQCGVYQADALLAPRDRGVAQAILMVERPGDYFLNVPSRAVRVGLLPGCPSQGWPLTAAHLWHAYTGCKRGGLGWDPACLAPNKAFLQERRPHVVAPKKQLYESSLESIHHFRGTVCLSQPSADIPVNYAKHSSYKLLS